MRLAYLRWLQLFVVDAGKPEQCYVTNGNERERILGTLAQMDRALTTTPTSDAAVPNIELALSLDDLPRRSKDKGTFFGYTRKEGRDYNDIWMMPNYAYWSWNYTHAPSWNRIRREIERTETEVPWAKKENRVVWRGKVKMATLRTELVRVSQGKPWSDIKPVVINDAADPHTKDVMNLRQFCGYRWLDPVPRTTLLLLTVAQVQVYRPDRGHIVLGAPQILTAVPLCVDHTSARMAGVPYASDAPCRPGRQLH